MNGGLPGTTFDIWFPGIFDCDHAIWDSLAEAVQALADSHGVEVHIGSTTLPPTPLGGETQ